ncbi:16S rRNA (cytosine(967)-C(5))-methyltransferase RsmB [Lachnobacterium bovis]|uniref:16S rRNA (cytosine(967)-C(5))-methyltransferase n=1 Tax=Lachnobacterium bovis DSM 14045 TaxID=1122142 RepID=A0A1H3MM04_9FIRM|nr:16S rRNA (cytosine(967)-C(5))-methyltransferase RsmB [Lachnobacterium bovis]SDY77590.1 16S rRNA (cytosine967-C5)-methyltransferase [Lachnobacterium bovis DSM 14045]
MADNVNTRELILDMLIEIIEKEEYSHIVLRQVLEKYQYLDKVDRAFITRITEGTLENLIKIDYIINQFSKVKAKKMKPLIRTLLRMSVYQLLYMDAVPDSAVCNEAVKIAKKRKFKQLSGFVNGVLRNIARNKDEIKYPDENKEPVKYLSVCYSMPEWIVKEWIDAYGREKTKDILYNLNTQKPLTIRTNLNKTTPQKLKEELEKANIKVTPIKPNEENKNLGDYAFEIENFNYLNSIEAFKEGKFYVQDLSSMMVAEYAMPQKNDYVIDVCAAPGGKSLHIAEMLDGTGMVEARDLTEYKVGLIEENIKRHKATNVKAIQWDATVLDENAIDKADVLICDLPCSGLGVLAKKPDIRYRMSLEQQKELSQLQKEILSKVVNYVKPGKTMIYSTCTINPDENEKNVQWILDNYPQMKLVEMKQIFPSEQWHDGFFIAKFNRTL